MRLAMPLALALLLAAPFRTAEAQLPEPPRRSKDNHHQASNRQHKSLRVMAHAWAECLAPHVARCDTDEIYRRIFPPLQNQYSDHAVWRLRQELIELIREDLHMSKTTFEQGGRAWIDGGEGVESALVEELVAKAVASSHGALAFEGWLGGPGSLEHVHHLVLTYDGATLERLASARATELRSGQRTALNRLYKRYVHELTSALPIHGGSQRLTRFESHVRDAFATTRTDRALDGLRSKLREALRYEATRNEDPGDAAGCLEAAAELASLVDEHLDERFWEQLRQQHRMAVEEPSAFKRGFREVELALADE